MKKLPRFAVFSIILLLLIALLPLQGYQALQKQDYERAALLLPWRGDLWEQAGKQAFSSGDFPEAIRLLEQASQRQALSPQGVLTLGEAHWQSGARQTALSLWQTFSRGKLASAQLFLRLRDGYQAEGQTESIGALLARGASLFPKEEEMRWAYALWLMTESPSLARPEAEAARSLSPQPGLRYEIVFAALNAAAESGDSAYGLTVCGRALAALDEWALAERALVRAAQSNPNYAEAWAWLGEARQHTGSPLALPALRRAQTLAPESAAVLARLGLYFQRQNDPAQALQAFVEAARLEPQNPAWQMALGEAYAHAGDLTQAYTAYLLAIRLGPQQAETWRALATFCLAAEGYLQTSGLPAALQAIHLRPDDWRNPDTLGRVLLALGHVESARRMFLRASELAPQEAAPLLHLGILYLEQSDSAQAAFYLQQAQSLDPQGEIGRAAGRLLEVR